MVIYLCDQCAQNITPEDLQSGRAQHAHGRYLCQRCAAQRGSRSGKFELAFCDRCQGSVPLSALRNGTALFIPAQGLRPGKIFCRRCRLIVERQNRQSLDVKFLVVLLSLFIGVPLVLGIVFSFKHVLELPAASSAQNSVTPAAESLRAEIKALKEQLGLLQTKLAVLATYRSQPVPVAKSHTAAGQQVTGRSSDNLTRNTSLKQLVQMIAHKSLAPHIQNLQNPDVGKRWGAMLALLALRDQSTIPILRKALQDQEPWIRNLAAKGLGVLGAQAATRALVACLHDRDRLVKHSAAAALEQITKNRFVFFEDLPSEEWHKILRAKKWLEKQKSK